MIIYLNHYLGYKVNHKHIYRLMKMLGLKAVIRRKRKAYDPHKPAYTIENILNRNFKTNHSLEKLLTDVTEFKLPNGQKAYLSAILNSGANKIIAYELGYSNNNTMVFNTVHQILNQAIPGTTLLRSDRGYQYTSPLFKSLLRKHGVIHSMSRVEKCIDNGPMGNFWGMLKTELFYLTGYESYPHLVQDIKKHIHFFNTTRVTLKVEFAIP